MIIKGLLVTDLAFWPAVCPCGCVGRTGPGSIFAETVRHLSPNLGLGQIKIKNLLTSPVPDPTSTLGAPAAYCTWVDHSKTSTC